MTRRIAQDDLGLSRGCTPRRPGRLLSAAAPRPRRRGVRHPGLPSTRVRCAPAPDVPPGVPQPLRPDRTSRSRRSPSPARRSRVMTEEGCGTDVAGGGEIMTAMAAGADPARVGVPRQREVGRGTRTGRPSRGRLRRGGQLRRHRAPGAVRGEPVPVLLRVIPAMEADTHAAVATGHAASKFGVPYDPTRGHRADSASSRLGCADCTPTSARNCSTSTNSRPGAASGCAGHVRGLRPRRRPRGALRTPTPPRACRLRRGAGRPGQG